jgi:hypothetical protein
MNAAFKHSVFQTCHDLISEKMNSIHDQMKELVEESANDSKSSAGDKHETGRAMMQQEQAQLGKVLFGLEQQKIALERNNSNKGSASIADGSLVFTKDQIFYISIALGKMEVDGKTIHVISGDSPLAKKMKAHTMGDTVEVNGSNHHIQTIL